MSALTSTQSVAQIVGQAGFTHVKNVTVIQSLWAGYGKLYRCQADGAHLVVKHFAPPRHAEDDSEDHLRKLRSYEVESAFYEKLSDKMIERGCIVPELVACIHDGSSIAIVMRDLEEQHGSFNVRRGNCMNMEEAKRLLSYMARFHSVNWMHERVDGLWPEGCFWQLGTRMDELEYLDRSWERYGLDRDMALRIHELVTSLPHRTVLHGDAKAANFFWFSGGEVGGYDLQYCGGGSPCRDLAYTLGCSMQERLIERHETELLRHYHDELTSHLSAKDAAGFTFETMQDAYDLCVTDLVRFMCGSRWWGNTDYLEKKAIAWLTAHR